MRGAARRRSCLGSQPLGFTRVGRRDDKGNDVCDKNGNPEYVPCIDPATSAYRKLMYELFVEKCWSIHRITKHFIAIGVDGWHGWTPRGITNLLWSATAVGVFIWNKTRREFDWETEKWVVVKNPRKDWVVYHDPALAIVPLALWKAARKKLAASRRKSPLTGRKPSRNQKSATTLFSGTLTCGYCGKELLLCRSTGKYKVMSCFNGRLGAHGCELSASKSTRIIERCLLGYLQDHILTEQTVEKLVVKANKYLAEEASKPQVDTAPLNAFVREKEAAIKKLFQRIEGCDDEALVQAYEKRISELQKESNHLKVQLHAVQENNEPPPAPLDLAAVKALLSDLRGLLNQEIPAAAEAIRALTGPIAIRQEKIEGKSRGAKWIATFCPDLLDFLRRVAKEKNCPDSITLEHLCKRIWITRDTVDLAIDHMPKYEQIAERVRQLAVKGSSMATIAHALGHTEETVRAALVFARTGQRTKTKPAGKKTGTRTGPALYMVLAPEVVRLRDQQHLSFEKIARMKKVGVKTIMRAYDRARPAIVQHAAEAGQMPKRGTYVRLHGQRKSNPDQE